jgi:hypothetical protein
MPNEIITVNQMEDYIQSEKEAIEILTDVVNGDYKLIDFVDDLKDYVRENYKANGMPKTYEQRLF